WRRCPATFASRSRPAMGWSSVPFRASRARWSAPRGLRSTPTAGSGNLAPPGPPDTLQPRPMVRPAGRRQTAPGAKSRSYRPLWSGQGIARRAPRAREEFRMTVQVTAPDALRDAPAVAVLGARLNGELIRPGDERYDATRALFDARFDRRPALIVRASGAADVIRAVDFAREQALPLAIRSGGHGLAGHGMVDDGVVVDLSGLQDVRLDPQRRRAHLQPGVTSALLAASAHPHGLALTTGDSATVAV